MGIALAACLAGKALAACFVGAACFGAAACGFVSLRPMTPETSGKEKKHGLSTSGLRNKKTDSNSNHLINRIKYLSGSSFVNINALWRRIETSARQFSDHQVYCVIA
jgi:hypothetical protein